MSIDSIKEISRPGSFNSQVVFKKGISNEQILKIKDEKEIKEEKSPQNIDEIASEVQIKLKRINTELRFEVDGQSGEIMIKIIDPVEDKVIRQIPSEELLEVRERIDEIIGVLYKGQT